MTTAATTYAKPTTRSPTARQVYIVFCNTGKVTFLASVSWAEANSQVQCTRTHRLQLCGVCSVYDLLTRTCVVVHNIKYIKLRQDQLALGIAGLTYRYFSGYSACHPYVGRCNEYWKWFRPQLENKWRVLRSSRPCYKDCWHTGLSYASLIGSNHCQLKGDKLPRDGTRSLCVSRLISSSQWF